MYVTGALFYLFVYQHERSMDIHVYNKLLLIKSKSMMNPAIFNCKVKSYIESNNGSCIPLLELSTPDMASGFIGSLAGMIKLLSRC